MIFEKNNLQTAQEWTKTYIELIASYVHPKTGNHLRSHLRAIMALDHRRLIRPGKKIRPNFLRSTSLLYKILPTSLGTCKPTFYTFYTSHLRWNSTMRRCFYHTDLGQNAVFHNFAMQIALIQYSGRWKWAWAFSKTVKKISQIAYPVLTFVVRAVASFWMNINKVMLQHDKEFIMFIFYLIWFNARHFEYSCKRCSLNSRGADF